MKKLLPCAILALCSSILPGLATAQIEEIFSMDATGLQVTADINGEYVYIPDQKNNALVIVNSSTLEVEQNIALPGTPQDVALDEDAGLAFITISSVSDIVVLDLASYEFQESIALPQPANEIVVTDNNIFATTFTSSSGIMRIDRNTNAYIESFSDGVFTYSKGALELSPDKNRLVFANRGISPGTLAVYDVSGGATPQLLLKNGHGDLGSNGQNIAIDPINGAFVSYAAGGGNGAGYTIAKLDMADFSWNGDFTTGAYPRAIHYSVDGYSAYTNNSANSVQIWDSNTFSLIDSFSVTGNPKDFVDLQGGALIGVLGDTEFAIYQVKEFTPQPPAPKFEGAMTGAELSRVICQNKTSGQRLVYYTGGTTFDCAAQGLTVNPGDKVKVVLHGNIH
jgi:hypothetical protein